MYSELEKFIRDLKKIYQDQVDDDALVLIRVPKEK